jgi:hypothetical protein
VSGSLLAKTILVSVLSIGMMVLVGLGRVTLTEGSHDVILLASALVVALGLRGAATITKGDDDAKN